MVPADCRSISIASPESEVKQILVSALVAAIVSIGVSVFVDRDDQDQAVDIDAIVARIATRAESSEPPVSLSYTMELGEDAWVDGARTPGLDHKPLADSSHSVCYLTKVEVSGNANAQDTAACAITIDDFTAFWEVTAHVPDGSRSSVRCNARCLVW
jgi:hypothetical protein